MKNRSNLMAILTLTLTLCAGAGLPAWAAGPQAAARPSSDGAARRLVEQIRADLRPIEEEIRNAPFLAALERGEVSRASLRAFAGEQYNIIRADLRSNAQMASRFGATPGGQFFRDLVNGEAIALDLILDFGRALGLSEADLQAYEPRPRSQTYPHYVATLAHYAADAEIAAAYLVNFPVFGENTGRMAAALRSRYGFTAQDTAFFDFFSSLPPSFEPDALAVIAAGLDGCAEERDVRRATRLLQAYEKDFWFAVGEE
jgi:pyrroloquinoline quinone (PQQ) biosynthesis protein C